MDNAQIVKRIAVEVMGWHKSENSFWWMTKENYAAQMQHLFDPLHDHNYMALALGKMRERGWLYNKATRVMFWKPDVGERKQGLLGPTRRDEHELMAEALAVLAALDKESEVGDGKDT